jgi:hypothetical protein
MVSSMKRAEFKVIFSVGGYWGFFDGFVGK